jgi:RNA polymerase sigma-70 factor (ECF subfamily)
MKYQNDDHYIELVLNGDTSAYAALVAKHKNLVFSIALKILNNREDAEEVAQDCFLKAYQALKSFEGKSKFSTWLYRIVYNAAISKTRKKKLDMIPMDNYVIHNYTEDAVLQGAEVVEAEERRVMVERALERLPAEDNLLITLFYKGDSSIDEISEITGLSASNVKVRLHRIRKKLYEEMSAILQKQND